MGVVRQASAGVAGGRDAGELKDQARGARQKDAGRARQGLCRIFKGRALDWLDRRFDRMAVSALHDSRVTAAPAGVAAHRVIFIDLARAVAVFLMVQGHTVSALLAPEYRSGRLFDLWVFQRGLTSCLFLLLSGFAFSIATSRHWPSHIRPSRAVVKRLVRFSLFILLGYALHFPAARFAQRGSVLSKPDHDAEDHGADTQQEKARSRTSAAARGCFPGFAGQFGGSRIGCAARREAPQGY